MRIPKITLLLLALPALPLLAQQAGPVPMPAPLPATADLTTPTVEIFGIFDEYLGYTEASGLPGNNVRFTEDPGGYYADRIGFRGSEAIGWGNARVNFWAENGFLANSGNEATAGTLFNRQCWIGFSGDSGEIRFGRQNTLLQTQLGNTDPFDGATYASFFNNFSGYASRFNNVLYYKTPVLFGGLTGQAQFAPGELDNTKTGLNLYVGSLEYRTGGWYLLANYQVQKSANTLVNVMSSFDAISYDWGQKKGQGKVYAAFYRGNNIGSNISTSAAAPTTGPAQPSASVIYNNLEGRWYNGYSLTGIYHVTDRFSIGGGYGWATDESSNVIKNNVREPALFASYNVNKKLMFYSTLAQMRSSGTGQFVLAAAGPVTSNTPAKGGNETGFQLGVCYFFGSGLI